MKHIGRRVRRADAGQFDLRPVSEGGQYKILLAHQALYAETYAGWGMDLVLCGHLHGGVVRLPGIGGVISPQLTLFLNIRDTPVLGTFL